MRRGGGAPDFAAIAQLYEALWRMTGSPVAALNRAAALAEAQGPAAGLAALATLADDPRLATYQPWWAARAELLARAGQAAAAAEAYDRAIGLESDPAVRDFLMERKAALRTQP